MVEHSDGKAKKPADVGQTVSQGESVQTKEKSLAELIAADSSVVRLGANSVFSYSSQERIVKLDKGTMLMHTPPGNGGATIESGGVTGAISGTTFMLTAAPGKCSICGKEMQAGSTGQVTCNDHPETIATSAGFALVVLEGGSVTKVTGPDGITVNVVPGQMAVVGPPGSGAPKVFPVNLTQILRTSPLINAFPSDLPSMPEMLNSAQFQETKALDSTGTTAVAISEKGDLLTAEAPEPDPYLQKFEMAFDVPGKNDPDNLANIATAAGGEAAMVTASSVAGAAQATSEGSDEQVCHRHDG